MRILTRLATGAFVTVLVLVIVVAVFKWVWDARYYDGYDAALPLHVTIRDERPFPAEQPVYRRLAFTFAGLASQPVPALAAFPLDGRGPFPCVVFLHGIGQEKEFLDEIAASFVRAGFALVTFDQYTRGERRLTDAGKLAELLALRRRGALTVIETRRLLDTLQTRDDVAPDRFALLGASYGAITGGTAAAFDKRIRAVVLCYGGGDFKTLLDNAGPAKTLLAWLLAPGDPVLHVAGISPRPVLLQNGTHDSVIGTPAARALHEAAMQPKEILWYDSDHVGLDRDHTWKVIRDAIDWLRKHP